MTRNKLGCGTGFGRRTLHVEQLERRAMLAGNVSASVSGGSLIIRGDNADNGVVISQTGPGSYLVTGIDTAGGPTTINGDPDATFTGVTGSFDVDLKKGDDLFGMLGDIANLGVIDVEAEEECGLGLSFGSGSGGGSASGDIAAVVVPGNLTIRMGDGLDQVALYVDVGGQTSVDTGNQDDAVFIDDSTFGGNLPVQTGKGADSVCVVESDMSGLLNVQTGDGEDSVYATEFAALAVVVNTGNQSDGVERTSFYVDTTTTIVTGSGNDGVDVSDFLAGQGTGPHGVPGGGAVTITTGDGNDGVSMSGFDASAVTINAGNGNNGISVEDAEIFTDQNGNQTFDGNNEAPGPLAIVTGKNGDGVSIESVTAATVTASLGAGNDGISIEDLLLAFSLVVDTGTGNDAAAISDVTSGGSIVITMGSGNDSLSLSTLTTPHLVANGGPGTDEFSSDLSIFANGHYDRSAEGVPDVTVVLFEIFPA